jgi:hypothetical protein
MRFIPRWVHWLYAEARGYFWIPCPTCDREFGGHEWRDIKGHKSSRPTGELGEGTAICPLCTAAGVGCVAWAMEGQAHTGCPYAPIALDIII